MFKINIEAFISGPINTNSYLIHDGQSGIVIDPGINPQKLLARIAELELKIEAILLTHAHFDHIGGLEEVRHAVEAPVYLHKDEQEWLGDPMLNASSYLGEKVPIRCGAAEHSLQGDEALSIGGWDIGVIHTPGHTPGSVTYYLGGSIFTGDVLFRGSLGRADFPGPGGDQQALLESIYTKLLTLPEETIVYAGHGFNTTIGREKPLYM